MEWTFICWWSKRIGISILTTANNNCRLAFGDVDDPDEGQINYDCNNGSAIFKLMGILMV